VLFLHILTTNLEECSRGSSANIVARLGAVLNSTAELCVDCRLKQESSSFLRNIQTGSGAHPASYSRGDGSPFSGGQMTPVSN